MSPPPNLSVESPLLGAVKLLIDLLAPEDRGALRPWMLARFDVAGYANRRSGDT